MGTRSVQYDSSVVAMANCCHGNTLCVDLLLIRFDCMAKEVTHTEMQQFVTEYSIDILPTQNVDSPRLKDSEFPDGRLVIQACDNDM